MQCSLVLAPLEASACVYLFAFKIANTTLFSVALSFCGAWDDSNSY